MEKMKDSPSAQDLKNIDRLATQVTQDIYESERQKLNINK